MNSPSGSDRSDDEDNTSDANADAVAGPSKPKWYKQSYNKEWVKDPKLADWVDCDRDSNTICIFCYCKFSVPNKSHLIQHADSTKHKKAVNAKKQQLNIGTFFKKVTTKF